LRFGESVLSEIWDAADPNHETADYDRAIVESNYQAVLARFAGRRPPDLSGLDRVLWAEESTVEGELLAREMGIPSSSADNDPRTAELLQLLQNAPDHEAGIAVVDLPPGLRDWKLLTACESEGLIEFARRRHVHIGGDGPHRKLLLEAGWNVAEFAKPNRKRVKELLAEALAEQVPPEIRLRVRLTYQGDAMAARQGRAGGGEATGADLDADDGTPPNTLGDLLTALETFERHVAEAERTREKDPRSAIYYRHRANALLESIKQVGGINRLEFLCDGEWGNGLKAENLRKLRGRVYQSRRCTPEDVDALPLTDFVEALEGKRTTNRGQPQGRPRRTEARKARLMELADRWQQFYEEGSWKEHRSEGTAKQQFFDQFKVTAEDLESAIRFRREHEREEFQQ
jgi:hypothetical protein